MALIDNINNNLRSCGFVVEKRLKPLKDSEIISFLKSLGFKKDNDFTIQKDGVYAVDKVTSEEISSHDDLSDEVVLIDEIEKDSEIMYKIIIMQ